MPIRCFLSRAADDPIAAEVATNLKNSLPHHVFEVSGRELVVFDSASLPWGSPVRETPEQALAQADVFLPLVTRAYGVDPSCQRHERLARPGTRLSVPVEDASDVRGLAEALCLLVRDAGLFGLVRAAVAAGRVPELVRTIEAVAGKRGHLDRLAPFLRALEQRVKGSR